MKKRYGLMGIILLIVIALIIFIRCSNDADKELAKIDNQTVNNVKKEEEFKDTPIDFNDHVIERLLKNALDKDEILPFDLTGFRKLTILADDRILLTLADIEILYIQENPVENIEEISHIENLVFE